MVNRRFARVSVGLLTVLTGIMTIIWLGGCPLSPQPQVPGTPTSDVDDDDGTDTTPPTGGTQPPVDDRPVTQPTPDDDDDDDDSSLNDLIGDLIGDGGSGGTAGPRRVQVTIQQPASRIQVPIGESVQVTFLVTDRDGALRPQPDGVQVTLFRDDDENDFPDGAAVLTRTNPAFQAGGNSYQLSTNDIAAAGLLDADAYGRFIVGVRTRDVLDRVENAYAPRAIIVKTELPIVALSAPGTQTIGIGTPLGISFTVTDADEALLPQPDGLRVVVARDDDADLSPDGDAVYVESSPLFGVGQNNYPFNLRRLLNEGLLDATGGGRFVFGVRARDAVGRERTYWAPGTVTVVSTQPGGAVTAPAAATGVRPGDALEIGFNVTDPDAVLKTQPTGIQLVVARDADANNQADGAPVLTFQSTDFAVGANVYALDTNEFVNQGLLDVNGFGRFIVGFRTEDSFDRVRYVWAPWALSVDSVAPVITWHRMALPNDNPTLTPQNVDGAGVVWIEPDSQLLTRTGRLGLWFKVTDNQPVTINVYADTDVDPTNGKGLHLVTNVIAGEAGATATYDRRVTVDLSPLPLGTYYMRIEAADAVADDPDTYYAPDDGIEPIDPLTRHRLALTDRLVGMIPVAALGQRTDGLILQGFEFNDLAGSSMVRVPDLSGNGRNELLIASRFGKPYKVNEANIGFGEAYMIYGGQGTGGRLTGTRSLNSVGATGTGSLSGLVFPGIRFKMNEIWSEGLSDVAVIPDMDGDGLPELAFSFPRVESLSLADPAFTGSPPVAFQHPELVADLRGAGNLELSAVGDGSWTAGITQFTRGGIVIVSSQNTILQNAQELNRKGDRIIDLHEVGQLFSEMEPPALRTYVRSVILQEPMNPDDRCADCEPNVYGNDEDPLECTEGCGDCGGNPSNEKETEFGQYLVVHDNYFDGQGPGGYFMPWTTPAETPPLSNPFSFGQSLPSDDLDPCDDQCVVTHAWFTWRGFCMGPQDTLWGTSLVCEGGWQAPLGMVTARAWTGFYGPDSTPTVVTDDGIAFPAPVGARVLGQSVEDHFGTTVASDGLWLYIAAPDHTALFTDVPSLGGADRAGAGVVYMYRVNTAPAVGLPTRSQLWIEPGQTWPNVDVHYQGRVDYTMPTPHNYIIETVGSVRGDATWNTMEWTNEETPCTPTYSTASVADGRSWRGYYASEGNFNYSSGTAGHNMDNVPQVVGPHADAKLAFVRSVGDINGDGVSDFAVGSPNVKANVAAGTGDEVGAVFVVYGRASGLQGDMLLERMALADGAPNRLSGVLLRGTSADARLARVIDGVFHSAGGVITSFNGDEYGDVLVGSEGSDSDTGEAIVIFGSSTLSSPEGGWTVADVVAGQRAVRFVGEQAGDLAGANVAHAGDVDGDGHEDILVAAPGAAGGAGHVYLIYGMSTEEIDERTGGTFEFGLEQVGTVDLPGAVFIGRLGSQLGGGEKTYTGTSPVNPADQITAYSRGVALAGDLDGDGISDIAISSILASPNNKTHAGEVYVIYGRRGEFAD
jgi:hypothetical protein